MKRPAIFGAVAVLLFLVTAASVRNYMRSMARPVVTKQTMNLTDVVVAAGDIPLGTTIAAENLRVVPWPADTVPAGVFSDPAAIVGWVTRSSVVRNEPLLPDDLANPSARGVLPLVIPAGMRAATVRVNEVSGIAGFISPGAKVDVITVMDTKDEGKGAFTLLENLEVLAIAQTMDHKDTKPTVVNTVTLLVTPPQAERLTLASVEGSLQLSLRNYQDREPSRTSGIRLADLSMPVRPVEPTPNVVTEVPTTVEVELIRGPDRVVQRF